MHVMEIIFEIKDGPNRILGRISDEILNVGNRVSAIYGMLIQISIIYH